MATDWIALGASVKRRPLNFMSGTAKSWYTQVGGGASFTYPYSIVGGQLTASKDNSDLWHNRQALLKLRRWSSPAEAKAHGGDFWSSSRSSSGALPPLAVTGVHRQNVLNLDIGSSFFTTKTNYKQSHESVYAKSSGTGGKVNYYQGPLFALGMSYPQSSTIWPVLPTYEAQILSTLQYGSKAIATTVPTSPLVSLSNFFGELMRDGLPDLVMRTIRRNGVSLDSLSREYLNYEFGWKPLVSDLVKLANIILDSNRIIEQYERDSGKPIARARSFPTVFSKTSTLIGTRPPSPGLSTEMFETGKYQGPLTKTEVSTTDFWFTATYSYFLDVGDDSHSRLKHAVSIAEKLLGFEITPEAVWNLMPWTWLVDWFVNIGDVFTNASAFAKDGLIMRRGYIMCETKVSTTYELNGIALRGVAPLGTISQTFESHSKLRKRAYPWGFGLTTTQFTARQMAIIAALGITQGGLGK